MQTETQCPVEGSARREPKVGLRYEVQNPLNVKGLRISRSAPTGTPSHAETVPSQLFLRYPSVVLRRLSDRRRVPVCLFPCPRNQNHPFPFQPATGCCSVSVSDTRWRG